MIDLNPYQVLGVSTNATQEEIKKAYRALVKKYHPDQYKGTAYEKEANEKLKEINEAYDILKNGGGKSSYYSTQQGGTSSSYSGSSARSYGSYGSYGNYGSYGGNTAYTIDQLLATVRQLLSSGRYIEAELLLKSTNIRNAEWYYLMGNVQWFKGWQLEARKYYNQAYNMNPNNPEYKAAYERANANTYSNSNGGYRDPRYNRGGICDACDCCDCCGKLVCLDAMCECMGGDLIPCC